MGRSASNSRPTSVNCERRSSADSRERPVGLTPTPAARCTVVTVYSYRPPDSASATSDAGGVKRSPYVAANSCARATKPAGPPS